MPRHLTLPLIVVALVLGTVSVAAGRAAVTSRTCGETPYSYAGVIGRTRTRGIAATIEPTAGPRIVHGHVAAWVGVGGVGLGPHGTNQWLQVGVAATTSATTGLYYELAKPNKAPRFVGLPGAVEVGRQHRIGVIEMIRRPNWWRVWLDGRPVTSPIFLQSSHAKWAPVATSESWNGGVTSCNAFGYRFMNIRSSPTQRDRWRPLTNAYPITAPGYSVRRTALSGLVVSGGAPLPLAPAADPPQSSLPIAF